MDYAVIADAYEKIEATTKRLEMTDLLVDLLKKTPKEVYGKGCLFDAGQIVSRFHGHRDGNC